MSGRSRGGRLLRGAGSTWRVRLTFEAGGAWLPGRDAHRGWEREEACVPRDAFHVTDAVVRTRRRGTASGRALRPFVVAGCARGAVLRYARVARRACAPRVQ